MSTTPAQPHDPGPDLPDLAMEMLEPAAIDVDVYTASVPETLLSCLQLLGAIAPDASRVRLVVTGDFVASVQQRLFEESDGQLFTLERGGGMVAAKTMPRADGSTDVLVPWWFFNIELSDEERTAAAPMLLHSVVHEAQHVATRQNEGEYEVPKGLSWRDQTLRTSAASVIEEFRAELGAAQLLNEDVSSWEPLDVLESFSKGLAAAAADYQDHLDVPRLVVDVNNAAVVAWRALAYVAAFEVHGGAPTQLTDEVVTSSLWLRMAEGRWDGFYALLQAFRAGVVAMPREDIDEAVARLADLLGKWLADLGFVWTDERFTIESSYFEDEDFLAAMAAR